MLAPGSGNGYQRMIAPRWPLCDRDQHDAEMTPIILIPARMGSTRLPGKPLAMIGGEPMIVHVWRRAMESGVGPVAVACSERAVAEAIDAVGGVAVMTDPALPRGSDRIHAALTELDPAGRHDVVINLQGDLPTLPPDLLRTVIVPLNDPGYDVGTLVTPIQDDAEAALPSVVKAACAFRGDSDIAPALYFSRLALPWGHGPRWHHIGVYAYRRAALDRFVTLPESPLEIRESLEQLRLLEAGMRIGVARAAAAPFGVDTAEDLERARRILQ
jgi:3-deoxy-manno-octulosonate cytidylyltransferase (CMP-KDO synthetase)